MYEAWDAPTAEEGIEMVREALEISEDCADAYVLLAEEEAEAVGEASSKIRRRLETGRGRPVRGALRQRVAAHVRRPALAAQSCAPLSVPTPGRTSTLCGE